MSDMALPETVRRLLIVEDELQIRRAVRNALSGLADLILEAATGTEGIDLAAAEQPDLIVLDLGLPDLPGIDVCREIRRWGTMPVVVLSARHSEREKVELLNAGADDYITKPFSTAELVARVRVQLRRTPAAQRPSLLTLPTDLTLDLPRRTASRHGQVIRLTRLEWEILLALALHAGRTLTHRQIFDLAWRRPFGNPQQYLRVHLTNLRRKIEIDPARPQIVITDPGVGYRCELPA